MIRIVYECFLFYQKIVFERYIKKNINQFLHD